MNEVHAREFRNCYTNLGLFKIEVNQKFYNRLKSEICKSSVTNYLLIVLCDEMEDIILFDGL